MLSLVTGGTGFIGSHIVRRITASGGKARCIVRSSSDVSAIEKMGAELWRSELSDGKSIRESMDGVDVVFHSAALVGEWLRKAAAYKVNVEGTGTLLDAALDAGVKKFVYISSLAVLGMRNHYGTSEDAPHRFTGDPYADTKIKAEQLVLKYCREKGLPAVIVRPGFVFGPGDSRFLPRMLNLLQEEKFVFLGGGNNTMNLVYIDNLIDVIMEAAGSEKAVGQVYNIRNKDQVTMRDFVNMISDITGMPRPKKSIPVPVAKTLAGILEFFARLANKNEAPFLNKARVKVASLNLDFDISKARRELNYSSGVTIKEGLKKTLEINP